METRVRLDRWDYQACRVILACLGSKVRRGHRANQDSRVPQVALARLEQPERQDLRVLSATPDSWVIPGFRALQANRVNKDRPVRLEDEVAPDREDPLDVRDSLESREVPDRMVLLACQDLKVLWDRADIQDLLAAMVSAVLFVELYN